MNTTMISYAPAPLGATTPGTPQPLPGAPKPGTPEPLPTKPKTPKEQLLDTPLVLFNGTWKLSGKTFSSTYTAGAMPAPRPKFSTPLTTSGPILRRVGDSFQSAVDTANRIASRPVFNNGADGETFHAAQAVLQASDGAWYVTAVRGTEAPHTWFTLGNDPRETQVANTHMSSLTVTPLNPAVKAVVGAYTWVNFTNEKYEPTFAAPAAA